MYIKKILIYMILLIITFIGINYIYNDIWQISDIWWNKKTKSESILVKEIQDKKIKFITYNLNDYNINKDEYNDIYNYFISLYKSSIVDISDKWILRFAITSKLNNKSKQELIDKIKTILINKSYIKQNDIIYADYSVELLKNIMNWKFNYIYDNSKWWQSNLFTIDNKNYKKVIKEWKIHDFFNDKTINSFKIGDDYYTDKAIPYSFIWLAGDKYSKKELLKMKYKWKIFQQWYDITKNSHPIIVIFKEKKKWTWLLITDLNKQKKIEINKIYNNIEEYITIPNKLLELTDSKWFSKQNQNIWQFTDFDKDKYYQLYLKNKWYKIIKKDKNKFLFETENNYIVMYFDEKNKYKYKIDSFVPTWYNYSFEVLSSVKTPAFISSDMIKKINAEIKKIWLPIITWLEIKRIWNFLIP